MDLAFGEPVDWDALDEETLRRSFVDSDFCEIRLPGGEVHRYIRAILPLPVPDLLDEFRFNIWVSVSERSWAIYRKGFDTGVYDTAGCFAFLMHEIPDYPGSWAHHADVYFRPDRLRPTVTLHDSGHPLAVAQKDGISAEQVARWAALSHQG